MLLYPLPPALFLHGPRMTALEQLNWAKPQSYRDVGILIVHVIIPPPTPSFVPTWSQNDSIGATKLSKATVYRDVGILVVHVIIPPPPSIVPTWSQNDSIGATKLSKATVLQRCRYPCCTCYYTPAHPQHCSYMFPEWQHWSNKTEQSHCLTEM